MTEARSESQKNVDVDLNPFIITIKCRMHKNYINKVCTKLDCASNEAMIIFGFLESVEFSLMRSQFFLDFRNIIITRLFLILKILKKYKDIVSDIVNLNYL
jgi:hypothetical protein